MKLGGQGILLMAKNTVRDVMPLCLGVSSYRTTTNHKKVVLTPCFTQHQQQQQQARDFNGEIPSLMTIQELQKQPLAEHVLWEFDVCSTIDGELHHDPTTGSMQMTRDNHSLTGPRCSLTTWRNSSSLSSFCLDGMTLGMKPFQPPQVMSAVEEDFCRYKWHQLVSFGDGLVAPSNALFVTVPHYFLHALELQQENNDQDHKYMCLGVPHLNDSNVTIACDDPEAEHSPKTNTTWTPGATNNVKDRRIRLFPCTIEENVIEWLYVPMSKHSLFNSHQTLLPNDPFVNSA